jgi:hypothetical protein
MGELLQPADIFLTRGRGFVSRLIRVFTRHIGESRTKVNHVGIVVEGGAVEKAIAVEALSRVVCRPLIEGYGDGRDDVAVYRPLNLTPEEIKKVVAAAERYVGRDYGYFMIALHFADWLLQGAYVFRRLGKGMDDYPICSWVVAHAYLKAGKKFGVDPGAASPDDIWDFVTSHPEKYQQVRPLVPLTRPKS